jgi:hypothetical protein
MKFEKILKSSLLVIVAGLMSATVAAQPSGNNTFTYGSGETIMEGDTVWVSKACSKYETRERIASWVFSRKHTIRQVDSKYHPGGVLLKSIYSWIPANAAVFISRAGDNPTRDAGPSYYVTTTEKQLKVKNRKTQTYEFEVKVYRVNKETLESELIDVFTKDSVCPTCAEVIEEPKPKLTKAEIDSLKAEEKARLQAEKDSLAAVEEARKEAEREAKKQEKDSAKVARKAKLDSIAYHPYDRFTVGVRAGFASTMALPFNANMLPVGYEARIDLQYAHYWPVSSHKGHIGIMLGLSAGYMNVNRHQAWDQQYDVTDEHGDKLTYHVTADDIFENTQQIQAEVPLMISWVGQKGFFFNVGPRFLLPVRAQHTQTISNANLLVTDHGVGVDILNSDVYGIISEEQMNFTCANKYSWNVLVGFELGYEFKLSTGKSFTLGAYANYGVVNAHYGVFDLKGSKKLESPIVTTPPTSAGVGTVEIKSLSETYTRMMGHLDAGVKLSFNFNSVR